MSSTSRKRLLSELPDTEIYDSPSKKPKLHHNSTTIVSSNWFLNKFDHQQFQQIFKTIDASQLIQSLNITHFINKEIAEYATGRLERCANNKCMNKVCILYQDKEIYDNNHSNINKFGYKWCSILNRYYCGECMDDVTSCDCDSDCNCNMTLKYIPECDKCDLCKSIIFGCNSYECFCSNSYIWHCDNCDFKCCDNCYGITDCIVCEGQFCKQCRSDLDGYYYLKCICNPCHDPSAYDKIIECNKCDLKCKLLFKSNKCLHGMHDGIGKMMKCQHEECHTYICLNCDKKHRNGKYVTCHNLYCYEKAGIRCNKHISEKAICSRHKEREKALCLYNPSYNL